MNPSNHITPRIGFRTASVAAGWVFVVVLVRYQQYDWYSDMDARRLSAQFALIGTFYGMVGWIGWMLTMLPGTLSRSFARLAAALIGSHLLQRYLNETDWIRYIIYFGGLMISQSAIFALIRVPAWRKVFVSADSIRQFSIADLLVGTTGIALLLGFAIHFQPPIEATEYWQVLFCIWILFPLISAAGCLATLERRLSRSVHFAATALLLATTGAFSLSYFDLNYSDGASGWMIASLYGMITLGYLLTMSALALAGRLDAAKNDAAKNLDPQEE